MKHLKIENVIFLYIATAIYPLAGPTYSFVILLVALIVRLESCIELGLLCGVPTCSHA